MNSFHDLKKKIEKNDIEKVANGKEKDFIAAKSSSEKTFPKEGLKSRGKALHLSSFGHQLRFLFFNSWLKLIFISLYHIIY